MATDCLDREIKVGQEVMVEIYPAFEYLDRCTVMAIESNKIEVSFSNFKDEYDTIWVTAAKTTIV
jgi:hypothetical protein